MKQVGLRMINQCCNPGCIARRKPAQGYSIGYGFALWACDIHADEWRLFDEALRQYERTSSEAYQEAFEKWESEFEENYLLSYPRPEPPNGFAKQT